MLGTIVNTGTIITGSIVGSLLKKGINEKYQTALYNAMGMSALMLGINTVVKNMSLSKYPVLFIVSLAIGSIIGNMLDIDSAFNKLVDKFSKSNLSKGLSTGILLYCIGSLSILGPMMSALEGDNSFLFTNATLDLVTSAVLASTYGIGMILAAPVLFLWQGSIYLLTSITGGIIPTDFITEISIVGGILIAGSGMGILNIKDLKTLNMLPSLAIPAIFFLVKHFI